MGKLCQLTIFLEQKNTVAGIPIILICYAQALHCIFSMETERKHVCLTNISGEKYHQHLSNLYIIEM